MSESVAMKILNQIYNLVVDLQNVERQINSIDTSIRRRAYSLEEMRRDKELE